MNLASYLLLDAFREDCEVAIVVSNDADLKTPIELAISELLSAMQWPDIKSDIIVTMNGSGQGPADEALQAAGDLLRARRDAHGLSQRQLALRAGTTQAAISRIERGEVSPTFATLASLLGALGEEPALEARRMASDHDEAHLAANLARPPGERLELAIGWNQLAGEVGRAGREARRAQ